jgi:hypothetical protein
MEFSALSFSQSAWTLAAMPDSALDSRSLPPEPRAGAGAPALAAANPAAADGQAIATLPVPFDGRVAASAPTREGAAALAAAATFARQSASPATLRAYKADWQHYADWCARAGFTPVPAAPATVGAYLASLATTHGPATIRRRLSAIGKMHRFNGLPWAPAHRDIQEPLRGLLRQHGRPVRKAAALSLGQLRRLVSTCDTSARGKRDRALLLIGFAGALRRSELVGLQVEDITVVSGGLRVRIARSKTDTAGEGREVGLPRGQHPETCPLRATRCASASSPKRTARACATKTLCATRDIATCARCGATYSAPDC